MDNEELRTHLQFLNRELRWQRESIGRIRDAIVDLAESLRKANPKSEVYSKVQEFLRSGPFEQDIEQMLAVIDANFPAR